MKVCVTELDVAGWTAAQGNRTSISSEVVTTDMMGGSIKKAQVGHVIITLAKTLQQKEMGLATIAITKSRVGQDGIVFENCKFDNATLRNRHRTIPNPPRFRTRKRKKNC